MSTAIAYPFKIDALGVLNSTDRVEKVYLDRLLTLLSTSPGQRPMLPDYGTNVLKSLYENDNDIQISIRESIKEAVGIWLPEIRVVDVLISSPDQSGTAKVDIQVLLPTSTLTTLSISTAIFNIDGTISRADF